MMKENSKNIMTYLQAHTGDTVTSDSLATALDINKKSVVGSVNALVRKKLAQYIDNEVTTEDGKSKIIKNIVLTDAGKAFDVNAPEEK